MTTEEMMHSLRKSITSGAPQGDVMAEIDRIAQALEERRRVEERLRRSHGALMTLARSPSIATGALETSLPEITETASAVLDVARSSIWTYNADQTSILCLELFVREQRTHESGVELGSATYPLYFRALREERVIAAHDAHTDPHTAEFSKGYLTPLGIGAMLDAPIRVGGRMIGVICNEHVGGSRHWTADEEHFAVTLADFIALAMESSRRRETEEQLRAMVQMFEESA
jgi:GAF domain-containing protein